MALLESANKSQQIRTIITLRADFYARCVEIPKLADILEATTQTELREMITRPAEQAGLEFEEGLPERILDDTGTEPGALALMAYALDELYHSGMDDRRLTDTEYELLGGVQGAIGKRAETVFNTLDEEAQNALVTVFREIVEVDERGEPTRRRADLQVVAPDAAAKRLVEALTGERARLLVQDKDVQGRPIVEVAHEALLRQWPRLTGWIEREEDNLRRRRQIQQSAQEWEAQERATGYLLMGSRLEDAQRWLKVFSAGQLEQEFIAASAETESRQKSKERQIAHRVQNFQRATVVLAIVGLLAIVATLVAFSAQQTSVARENTASTLVAVAGQTLMPIPATLTGVADKIEDGADLIESLRLAALANGVLQEPNGNPEVVALLSIRALKTAYSPQADAGLVKVLNRLYVRQIFSGHTDRVYSVAYSHDGRYALTGSIDGTARLWNIQTGEEVRQFTEHTGGVSSVAFSPDGRYLLTGGCDEMDNGHNCVSGTARLRNTETGEEVRQFIGHAGSVFSVAFSPDGRYILIGDCGERNSEGNCVSSTAWLIDATTGEEM